MDLISLVIYLVVIGLIFWLLLWAVGAIGVPEPFNKIIRVVIIIAAVLIVLNILLSLIGHPVITVPRVH